MRARLPGFLVIAAIVLMGGAAHADAEEWRLSVAAAASGGTLEHASASTDVLAPGGRARLAYGLTNSLELGADLGVGVQQALSFSNAMVDGHRGTLYVDYYGTELTLDLRWRAGVTVAAIFENLHPFIGLRLGVLAEMLTAPQLLDSQNRDIPGIDTRTDFSFLPIAGVDVGLEYRFGNTFALGGSVGVTTSGSSYTAGALSLEASWHWY